MIKRLTIALVAHDAMKHDLAEWVAWNWEKLLSHRLICTGTTGRIVTETIMDSKRAYIAINIVPDICRNITGIPACNHARIKCNIFGIRFITARTCNWYHIV